MATIQHRSYDKTVANIPERNAISPRRPGMTVLVRDAIGDPYAGSGRAVYRWDEVQASWILMFKDNVETLTFTGESKTISQDQIQLSFVPANGQVWDVMVRDGLVAHQVEHSVAGSVVTIQPDTPGQFDGKQLSVRYAYGTMTQQLDLEIARVVGEAVGAFDKEALGLGNVDNTSDLNKPLSTAAQTALARKSDTGHAHAEVTTSAAGFMSAADKTKLDGVEDGANNYAHPTGDGNLHVPATGTTNAGKVLTAGDADGSLSWTDPLGLGSTAGTAPGTASAGTATTAARSDHVHPLQSSVTGNAGTATKLATARTLTVGNTGKTFDGSANLTWTLDEIGATGLQYLTEVRNVAQPNATVPVHGVRVDGIATDIDLLLAPKGDGAIVAQVPDNAANGGVKRGARAVDLQMSRLHANQVASGGFSFAAGFANQVSGHRSTVPGGQLATTNSLLGLLAYGFNGGAIGQNQMAFWGGRAETSTTSARRITADGGSASATNQLTLRNNSAVRVRGTVVARHSGNDWCKEWTFEALIKRKDNANETSIVGTPTITSTFADADTASWAIAISADTNNGALAITATGTSTAQSIRWTAVVHSIEVA